MSKKPTISQKTKDKLRKTICNSFYVQKNFSLQIYKPIRKQPTNAIDWWRKVNRGSSQKRKYKWIEPAIPLLRNHPTDIPAFVWNDIYTVMEGKKLEITELSTDERPVKVWYIEYCAIKSSTFYIDMEKYLIYIK